MAKSKHIDVSKYNTTNQKSRLEKINEFLSKNPFGPTLTDKIMDNLLKSYFSVVGDNIEQSANEYNFALYARRNENPSSLEVEGKKLRKVEYPKMLYIDIHKLQDERNYFRNKISGGFIPEREYPCVVLSSSSCFGGVVQAERSIKKNENDEHFLYTPFRYYDEKIYPYDIDYTINQKSIKKMRIEFVNNFDMGYFLSGFFTYVRNIDTQYKGKISEYIGPNLRNGELLPSMPQLYLETLYRTFEVSYTIESTLVPGSFKLLYPVIHNKDSGRDILSRHLMLEDIETTLSRNLYRRVEEDCCTDISLLRGLEEPLDSAVITEMTKMTCYINEHWSELLKLLK